MTLARLRKKANSPVPGFALYSLFPVTPSTYWQTRALIQTFKTLQRTTLSTMIMIRYILHFNHDQLLQNLRIKKLWNFRRPWTMWRAARWWWPRPGSCLTSSSGKSSPTSSGSPACTSWRLELVLIESISCPGLSLSFWCGLCSAKRLSLYKEVHPDLSFALNQSEYSQT